MTAAVITEIILLLMTPAPRRELYQNAEMREQMAQDIIDAGQKYDQPPILLTVWFFGESSLRATARGALREKGISQLHPSNWRKCTAAGHDVNTSRGQIMCGAMLADKGRRYCGGLRRGWNWYGSGNCHRGQKTTNRRFRKWRKLERDVQR